MISLLSCLLYPLLYYLLYSSFRDKCEKAKEECTDQKESKWLTHYTTLRVLLMKLISYFTCMYSQAVHVLGNDILVNLCEVFFSLRLYLQIF